jgi:lipoate-protein ligase B
MRCVVYQLGLIKYDDAYHLQQKLLYQRLDDQIEDTLLLLEHPPVITIGKSGKLENVLASPAQLAKEGVSLVFVDRGGDVTYHGPGQIVGYPIFDLRERGRDAHQYLHNLEEVLIRTLNDFSIKSSRDSSHAGVWVRDEEIAAIGLSIRKWISMHGFALNVNTDLAPFSLINPCGFDNRKATSLAKLLGQEIPMETVTERLLAHFAEVFDAQLELGTDILERSYDERKTATLV